MKSGAFLKENTMNNPNYSITSQKFSELESQLFEFENLLNSNNILIKNNTSFEHISLNIFRLIDIFKNQSINEINFDFRNFIREISGLSDLIRRLIKVANHKSFKQLLPHLKILNSSIIPQNMASPINDSGNDKIFELLIASSLMNEYNSIKVDHPLNPKGDNPDIIYELGSINFSIACKTMHTPNIKTCFERFQEGVTQINKSKSNKGVVLINLKNVINHDEFWPEIIEREGIKVTKAFKNIQDANMMLNSYFQKYKSEFTKGDYLIETSALLKSSKSLPCLIFFMQTNICTIINDKNAICLYGNNELIDFGLTKDDLDYINHLRTIFGS